MPADLASHPVFNSFYSKNGPNLNNKLFITQPYPDSFFWMALMNYVSYCRLALLFSSFSKGTVNSTQQSLFLLLTVLSSTLQTSHLAPSPQ